MIRKVLENIPGIEFYPLIALVFFVLFFTALILWFVRADKTRLAALAQLPLDDTLHTPHSTMHTPHSTMHTAHSILHNADTTPKSKE